MYRHKNCNKYLLSFLKFSNDRADAVYEEGKELYKYVLKIVTEMILDSMEDMNSYSICREFEEMGVLLPAISELEIMNMVRDDRGIYIPVFEKSPRFISSERIVYTRKTREFGFSICNCMCGPADSLRIRISPYLGDKSREFTEKEINKKFLDNEFGKKKIELEKTYICGRDYFVYKGKKIYPVYDGEGSLRAIKQ